MWDSLALHKAQQQEKAKQIVEQSKEKILDILLHQPLYVNLGKLKVFEDEKKFGASLVPKEDDKIDFDNLNLFYVEVVESPQLLQISDLLIREFIKQDVLDPKNLKELYMMYDEQKGIYRPQTYHVTMFRITKCEYVNEKGEKEKCQFERILQDFGQKEIGTFEAQFLEISQFYQPIVRI